MLSLLHHPSRHHLSPLPTKKKKKNKPELFMGLKIQEKWAVSTTNIFENRK